QKSAGLFSTNVWSFRRLCRRFLALLAWNGKQHLALALDALAPLLRRSGCGFLLGNARGGLRRIGPRQPALLRARWSVNAAGGPGGICNKTEISHGARACVLEGLPQAFAGLVSDRPLHRDIIDRAGLVPPDQQEDRQPAAAAAGRRGHARARRRPRQGARLRVLQERLHPSG